MSISACDLKQFIFRLVAEKILYVLDAGTMLQAGRSPVRVPDEVDFSIYLIIPAVL
jgi:phosphorylcholine metabolism protein LicD